MFGGAERGSVLDGVHCENLWYLTWWLVGDLIQNCLTEVLIEDVLGRE